MTGDRDRFNTHNDSADRIPEPLLPAHGTRLLTCPRCKTAFEPPPDIQMTQCPNCHTALQISTPTYTRDG